MARTYKAVEAAAPGNLRIVERLIPQPGKGQVLIRVEACGICHTDSFTVEGQFPGLHLPRVPGHEVAGRIEAIGAAGEILSIVRISRSPGLASMVDTRK